MAATIACAICSRIVIGPIVLAVRSNQTLRLLTEDGLIETDPATIADEGPAEDWARRPGRRRVRRASGSMTRARMALPRSAEEGFELASDPAQPQGTRPASLLSGPRAERARRSPNWPAWPVFAGRLRSVERAKSDLGLDHCEARSWAGVAL